MAMTTVEIATDASCRHIDCPGQRSVSVVLVLVVTEVLRPRVGFVPAILATAAQLNWSGRRQAEDG